MSSPAPPLDLPWPKLPLRELALPAGVRVSRESRESRQLSTRATWRLVVESGSRKLPTYLPPGRGGLGAIKSYLPT